MEHFIDECPGRHRWVDLAQHEFNASQVPPEWHSWISHIRKDAPTEDSVIQSMTPPWKAVSFVSLKSLKPKKLTAICSHIMKT